MVRQATSKGYFMSQKSVSAEAKAVVRRSIEEVQDKGRFDVFEELFAHDFVDHTTQPGTTPDKAGVRYLYTYMRQAFPDFHAEIHWQLPEYTDRRGHVSPADASTFASSGADRKSALSRTQRLNLRLHCTDVAAAL